MDKKNLITFVDLGTTGVRACSFNIETKKIESNFDLPINKEELNNLTSKDEIIEKLVFNIEKKNGEYLNEIYLMVDDLNILPITITNFKKSDGQISDNELSKHLTDEVKYQINKNYPKYEVVHMVVKNYILDKKKFFNLPKDLHYSKFSIEFLFILYPKSFIEKIKKIFEEQNVSIKKIIFSSYSKSLFYLNKINSEKKVIFVDIGYEKTCAFLFNNKKIDGFKILPIGGNHITKDISKILKIDNDDAEDIKLNFDNINYYTDKKSEDLELIKKIIFSRTEELLEISTLFAKANDGLENVKLVFFGNGSKDLDNKFKSNIIFNHDIDLLDENYMDICLSGFNFINSKNELDIDKIDTKGLKKGFFERFFHLFN